MNRSYTYKRMNYEKLMEELLWQISWDLLDFVVQFMILRRLSRRNVKITCYPYIQHVAVNSIQCIVNMHYSTSENDSFCFYSAGPFQLPCLLSANGVFPMRKRSVNTYSPVATRSIQGKLERSHGLWYLGVKSNLTPRYCHPSESERNRWLLCCTYMVWFTCR